MYSHLYLLYLVFMKKEPFYCKIKSLYLHSSAYAHLYHQRFLFQELSSLPYIFRLSLPVDFSSWVAGVATIHIQPSSKLTTWTVNPLLSYPCDQVLEERVCLIICIFQCPFQLLSFGFCFYYCIKMALAVSIVTCLQPLLGTYLTWLPHGVWPNGHTLIKMDFILQATCNPLVDAPAIKPVRNLVEMLNSFPSVTTKIHWHPKYCWLYSGIIPFLYISCSSPILLP